ncbi:MAG: hypothetical protein IPK32_07560 [Verrucomicrobiaceae bacterium]|nr:hypothetical protein [Verrucomicrobiaceae bacterium]
MNSSNTTTAPPRRFKWLRRLFWATVCFLSLVTVLWQWENWRSARELKEMRRQLIERIGTDDPLAFAPPKIADHENYFAIPSIEAWATEPLEPGSHYKRYHIPEDAFWPKGLPRPELLENEVGGISQVKWAASSDLEGESPAVALNRKLGDMNGLLPKLVEGLNRPFSCLKPGLREAQESALGELWNTVIPNIGSLNQHQRALDLHLRCAAMAGDRTKAWQLAMISLRLFPESAASHGSFVSALVALASHNIAFRGLQDALSRPVWEERGLALLQAQLAKENDLHYTVSALGRETLWMHAQFLRGRERRLAWRSDDLLDQLSFGEPSERICKWAIVMGPIGWHDADTAHYLRCIRLHIGPNAEDAWLDADKRRDEEQQLRSNVSFIAGVPIPNPRRFMTSVVTPNFGGIHTSAAKTLFHRRCLIFACELEKHRMQHGSYPTALPELKGYELSDPARPGHLPSYRLEPNGYLLWSAGPDAIDDHGDTDKDWLWRMKRTP